LQERDVPDVTDIASKVHQAADAVEAAASNLQEMLGDASAAVTEAFGGLEGRVAGLKQQLLKGEKTIEAMVDEVSTCTVLHLVECSHVCSAFSSQLMKVHALAASRGLHVVCCMLVLQAVGEGS
jgi:hypothetical protein